MLKLNDEYAGSLTHELIRQRVEADDFLLAEFCGGVLETYGLEVGMFVVPHPRAGDFTASDGPLGLGNIRVRGRVIITHPLDSADVAQLVGELEDGERGLLVCWQGYSDAGRKAAMAEARIELLDSDFILNTMLERYDQLDAFWREQIPLRRVLVPTMEMVAALPD
jgi:hypothetical protein